MDSQNRPRFMDMDEHQRKDWAASQGRGMFGLIAKQHRCSKAFVSQVHHGLGSGPKVAAIQQSLDRAYFLTGGYDAIHSPNTSTARKAPARTDAPERRNATRTAREIIDSYVADNLPVSATGKHNTESGKPKSICRVGNGAA